MREIKTDDITETVAHLFEHSCHYLPSDVVASLKQAREKEKSPTCRDVLDRRQCLLCRGGFPIWKDKSRRG